MLTFESEFLNYSYLSQGMDAYVKPWGMFGKSIQFHARTMNRISLGRTTSL